MSTPELPSLVKASEGAEADRGTHRFAFSSRIPSPYFQF